MAYDQTGIVNFALTPLGAPPITDIDEDSAHAITARTVWQMSVDFVMADFPWVFAKKRVALSKSATSPNFEYTYQYDLPPDYMRMLKVFPAYGLDEFLQTVGFGGGYVGYVAYYGLYLQFLRSRGYVVEGNYLLSNKDNTDEDLNILYSAKIDDISQWNIHFCNAVSYFLAHKMAMKITQSPDMEMQMLQLYEAAKLRAWQVNQSSDYIEGEKGNEDWAMAGRSFMRGWRITY
jgi:hypothetical protein